MPFEVKILYRLGLEGVRRRVRRHREVALPSGDSNIAVTSVLQADIANRPSKDVIVRGLETDVLGIERECVLSKVLRGQLITSQLFKGALHVLTYNALHENNAGQQK